jgi:hypothetical protein
VSTPGSPPTSDNRLVDGDLRGPSFDELVRAHWLAERDASHEARYGALLEAFTRRHGEILDVYWSTDETAAVALTSGVKKIFRPARIEYHRATSWLQVRDADIAALLFRCESLAVRARESLSAPAARIALYGVFAVSSRALAAQTPKRGAAADELTAMLAAQLGLVEAHVESAGRARASWTLFVALLSGLGLVVGVTLAVSFGLDSSLTRPAVAVIAGSVGATLGALSRMSTRRLIAPSDVGDRTLYLLGLTRSGVGALLGSGVYFVLAALAVAWSPPHELYAALGFLAGFGERFAQVLPSHASDEVEIKSLQLAVEETVRSSLLGSQLAKWTGFVSVSLGDAYFADGLPIVSAGDLLELNVQFTPHETGQPFERVIDIGDGVEAAEATFRVRADCDTVATPSQEDEVVVAAGGKAAVVLRMNSPTVAGEHRIWVRVSQLNRIIQLVPLDVRVEEF